MYVYDPHLHVKHILIIGVGGTGSVVARQVANMVYDMDQRQLDTPHITLIDGDTVAANNIGRQPFAPKDVGDMKAVVIARRLNAALGLDIAYDSRFFNADSWQPSNYALETLVIGCVDNYLARQEIAQLKKCVVIDCGNSRQSGQVIIGDHADPDQFLNQLSAKPMNRRLSSLPSPYIMLPTLLKADPTPQPERSCAEQIAQGEQHLLINQMIGLAASSIIYRLLHRQPISTFLTFAAIDPFATSSITLTDEHLKSYLQP